MASHAIIVRNITDFQAFIARIQQDAAAVHSLSIVIEPEALVDLSGGEVSDPLGASESTQQLWRLLEEELGVRILPSLHSLTSFSLRVLRGRNHFWLPRPLLAALLSRLPGTCKSVEIDTFGSDRAEPGTRHLCETVRDILSRLEHLRLNLSTMCAKGWEIETQCAQLTALTISCFAGGYHNSRLCGSYAEDPFHSAFSRGEEAMPHLVHQIQAALHQLPSLNHCIVVDQSGSPSTNSAFHLTYNLRNVLKDTVTAMPVECIHPFADDGDGYMLRTLIEDVFGSRPALKAVLEKGVLGQRCSDMASSDGMEGPYQLLSLDAWKTKYPKRSCRLWANERREGRRLVDACVMTGAATRVRLPVFPEFEGQVLRDLDAGD
ncbi:hypothetical protein MBLNU13_g01916t1 [Cladosporium sp. NU13]